MAFFPLFSSVTTSVELNFLPTVSNIPFKTETLLSLQPAWIKEHASYVSLHRLTFAQGEISSEKGTAFLLPTLLVVIENGSVLILPYDNKKLSMLLVIYFTTYVRNSPNTRIFLCIQTLQMNI